MSETLYIYKRGIGWIPRPVGTFCVEDLDSFDYREPWIKLVYHSYYPAFCKDWLYIRRIEGKDLKIGDFIPYGMAGDFVVSLTPPMCRKVYMDQTIEPGISAAYPFDGLNDGSWTDIARAPDV